MKRSALDPSLLRAIAQLVECDHGTYDDACQLAERWEVVNRENGERAARIRAQVVAMPTFPEQEPSPLPARRRRREYERWALL